MTCELFALGETGLLVTVPEPQAIETTYRFIRGLYSRELRSPAKRADTPPRPRTRARGLRTRSHRPSRFVRYLAKHDAGLRCGRSVGAFPRFDLDLRSTRRASKAISELAANLTYRLCEGGSVCGLILWAQSTTTTPFGSHIDSANLLLVNNPSSKAGRGLDAWREGFWRVRRAPRMALEGATDPASSIATDFGQLNHYERLQNPQWSKRRRSATCGETTA